MFIGQNIRGEINIFISQTLSYLILSTFIKMLINVIVHISCIMILFNIYIYIFQK